MPHSPCPMVPGIGETRCTKAFVIQIRLSLVVDIFSAGLPPRSHCSVTETRPLIQISPCPNRWVSQPLPIDCTIQLCGHSDTLLRDEELLKRKRYSGQTAIQTWKSTIDSMINVVLETACWGGIPPYAGSHCIRGLVDDGLFISVTISLPEGLDPPNG